MSSGESTLDDLDKEVFANTPIENIVNVRQFYPDISADNSQQLTVGTSSKHNQDDSFDIPNRSALPNTLSTAIEDLQRGSSNDLFVATEVSEQILAAARQRRQSMRGPKKTADDQLVIREQNANVVTVDMLLLEKANEHFGKGARYIGNAEYEKAITCLTKAVNLNPTNVTFLVQRAEAYLKICDFPSAVLNYKRVCVLNPENEKYYHRLAFIYFLQGQCLFDQQCYAEALEAFSRATEMRPDAVGYHMRSIACLASLHRHGECLALVNKRLEVDSRNADLLVLRARLQRLFRNITLCYYDIKDALAIDPGHAEALKMMETLEARAVVMRNEAMHLNLLGRTRDALQKISIAIETSPCVGEFHIIRGALHRRLSDFNAAIDDFLLAMDKTGHDENSDIYKEAQRQLLLSYNDFAVECFMKGFYEEAIILLNKAIKGEKSEKGLYINRGDCFFKGGHLQFAQADYQQALELDPTDTTIAARIAVVQNEYGVQEYQERNFQEAEFRFTMAVQHNPTQSQYYLSRARTRQLLENADAASQDILISLYLDPQSTEVITQMSRLFPGKAVAEVLSSPSAVEALKFLRYMLMNASPDSPHLEELQKHLDAIASTPSKTSDIAITKPKHGIVPKLKACMEEREFHIKIVHQKKTVNAAVKNIMTKRTPLKHTGARMQPLPPVVMHKRDNSQQSTGWRNFGRYVSIR